MSETEYWAMRDPDDPDQMTYWRRDRRGKVGPWPIKARYGPMLYRRDVPAGLTYEDRYEFARRWYREVRDPWDRAVREAYEADPESARARFAALQSRCCQCGKTLTDPGSKTYGVGPECRSGYPAEVLEVYARAMGRVHAGRPGDVAVEEAIGRAPASERLL